MLKTFGVVLRRRDGLSFETLVSEACAPDAGRVSHTGRALLTLYTGLKQQIGALCQGKREMPAAEDHSGIRPV